MVRHKHEIYDWFRELDASSRIDFVCSIFELCLPVELRLFGACLEEQARKDYLSFRDLEIKANDHTELHNLSDLYHREIRSRLAVYMCLLHSRPNSYLCSKILYDILSSIDYRLQDLLAKGQLDEPLINDFRLLLTIAYHHPAFNFRQKQQLSRQLQAFEDPDVTQIQSVATQTEVRHQDEESKSLIEAEPQRQQEASRSQDPDSIASLELISVRKTRQDVMFEIQVWTMNGQQYQISKSFSDIKHFHSKLIGFFPDDTKAKKGLRHIPLLRAIEEGDKVNGAIETYLSELCKMPTEYKNSLPVRSFFLAQTSAPNLSQSTTSQRAISVDDDNQIESELAAVIPQHTVIVTNSQQKTRWPGNATGPTAQPPHSPSTLSLQKSIHSSSQTAAAFPAIVSVNPVDPTSSHPTNGPLNSTPTEVPISSHSTGRSPNSASLPRAVITPPFDTESVLHHLSLKKYKEQFEDVPLTALMSMTKDDFQKRGMTTGAARRLFEELSKMRSGPRPPVSDSSGSEISSPSPQSATMEPLAAKQMSRAEGIPSQATVSVSRISPRQQSTPVKAEVSVTQAYRSQPVNEFQPSGYHTVWSEVTDPRVIAHHMGYQEPPPSPRRRPVSPRKDTRPKDIKTPVKRASVSANDPVHISGGDHVVTVEEIIQRQKLAASRRDSEVDSRDSDNIDATKKPDVKPNDESSGIRSPSAAPESVSVINITKNANNNEPVPVLLPGQNISPYEGEVVFVTGPNGFKHYGEIESTYPGETGHYTQGIQCPCPNCMQQPPYYLNPNMRFQPHQNGVVYPGFPGFIPVSNGLISPGMPPFRTNGSGPVNGMIHGDIIYQMPTFPAPRPQFQPNVDTYGSVAYDAPGYVMKNLHCTNCGLPNHTRLECPEPADILSNRNTYSLDILPRSDASE